MVDRCPSWWDRLTDGTTTAVGTRWAVLAAVAFAGWGVLADRWEVVDRTVTVVSLLINFLVLSSTGRGDKATHVKLDEMVRAHPRASNAVLSSEDLSAEQLDARIEEYRRLRDEHERRRDDDGGEVPDVRGPGPSPDGGA